MKTSIAALILCLAGWLLLCSMNYQGMIKSARLSEGTDSAIQACIYAHGYENNLFEQPTLTDFLTAPIDLHNTIN